KVTRTERAPSVSTGAASTWSPRKNWVSDVAASLSGATSHTGRTAGTPVEVASATTSRRYGRSAAKRRVVRAKLLAVARVLKTWRLRAGWLPSWVRITTPSAWNSAH